MKAFKPLVIATATTLSLGLSQGAWADYTITNTVTVDYFSGTATSSVEDNISITVNSVYTIDTTDIGSLVSPGTNVPPGSTDTQTFDIVNTGNVPVQAVVTLDIDTTDSDGACTNGTGGCDFAVVQNFSAQVNQVTNPASTIITEQTATGSNSGTALLGGTVTSGAVTSGGTVLTVVDSTYFAVGDIVIIEGNATEFEVVSIPDGTSIELDQDTGLVSSFGVLVSELARIELAINDVGEVVAGNEGTIDFSVDLAFLETDGATPADSGSQDLDPPQVVSYTVNGTNLTVVKSVSTPATGGAFVADNTATAEAGDTITYQLVITNTGLSATTALTITDVLSGFTDYAEGTVAIEDETGAVVTFTSTLPGATELGGSIVLTPDSQIQPSGFFTVTYDVVVQ